MQGEPAGSTGKTILVVDDDASTCVLVRNFLRKFGYDVLTAGDAGEGMRILETRPIDLVISDVIMPGKSGFELLAEIKKTRPLLPVIIITGKPKVEAAVACIKTGAFDYLTKPLNLNRFLEHVEEGLAASARVKSHLDDNESERLLSRWSRIAGYDLRQVLGEGGLGIVFLAEKDDDRGVRQRYALKIMKPELIAETEDGEKTLERFMREAKMAASIVHPNVIRIYGYGLAQEEQIPYIVMEYIQGRSLSYYIMNGDLLDYTQKAGIIRQAASALAAVHGGHMCHRDIKPDNILVSDDLHVTLTDFGIATSVGVNRLTTTGFLIGSPAYMSPEAYDHKETDARSDIFALGTVMYELFLGVSPFVGDTLQELSTSIRAEAPPEPRKLDPALPVGIARIIERMLAKDVASRYQSARGVVAALDEFLAPNSLLKNLVKRLNS